MDRQGDPSLAGRPANGWGDRGSCPGNQNSRGEIHPGVSKAEIPGSSGKLFPAGQDSIGVAQDQQSVPRMELLLGWRGDEMLAFAAQADDR